VKSENIFFVVAFISLFVVYFGEFINFYLRKINIIRLFDENGVELSISKKHGKIIRNI
jgi:hypothetical protein